MKNKTKIKYTKDAIEIHHPNLESGKEISAGTLDDILQALEKQIEKETHKKVKKNRRKS